ncbi:hypothetical protein JR316_0012074 [Psilocybe cubensis]|uniref:Uncharacterized protein n=1 Tax=Psilocybe cubensis TaxID=181762 RepID=A0ACB8GHP6_PSICU|nr:hypothetical protein JR316_0012074 [Psilocybe cubensis]KAH9474975.1 hypothetical protein JR316_0012074 [Psilocybe cubensis]
MASPYSPDSIAFKKLNSVDLIAFNLATAIWGNVGGIFPIFLRSSNMEGHVDLSPLLSAVSAKHLVPGSGELLLIPVLAVPPILFPVDLQQSGTITGRQAP